MTMQAKPYLRSIALVRDRIPSFDAYPFNIPAVRTLTTLDFHPDVTFLVGENGTGKSTLVEAIALAIGFGPEGGTRNVQFSTAASVSDLHKYIKTVKSFAAPKDHYFLRAESFFNVATYMDEVGYLDGYGGKSLHQRSHGEAFMAALTMKFKGKGLYILDEPEAALSPSRLLTALAAIHRLVTDDSQFIIATHSPILLAYPNAKLLSLDDSGIKEISYHDTEHYAVTKGFLNHHEQMLGEIMKNG